MSIQDIWAQYKILEESISNQELSERDENACVNCKEYRLVQDASNGIIVCSVCGVVNEFDMIDKTAEWSSAPSDDNNKKDQSRCGCPINPLLEKSSMSTLIKTNKFHFMKRLHNQMSMGYVERSRYHVFEQISQMAGETGKLSPAVIEQSKYFYKILSERKLSRGLIRKGLIACCIIYACKIMHVPRSLKEISVMTNVPIPTLNKTMKIFVTHMNDVLIRNTSDTFIFEATECKHLINRYCSNLRIKNKNDNNNWF